jgi:hypothetical protein
MYIATLLLGAAAMALGRLRTHRASGRRWQNQPTNFKKKKRRIALVSFVYKKQFDRSDGRLPREILGVDCAVNRSNFELGILALIDSNCSRNEPLRAGRQRKAEIIAERSSGGAEGEISFSRVSSICYDKTTIRSVESSESTPGHLGSHREQRINANASLANGEVVSHVAVRRAEHGVHFPAIPSWYLDGANNWSMV